MITYPQWVRRQRAKLAVGLLAAAFLGSIAAFSWGVTRLGERFRVSYDACRIAGHSEFDCIVGRRP